MLFEGRSMCDINAAEVVSSEGKNRHILKNPTGKDVYKYHVDGDIVKEGTVQRCDYIVEVNESNSLVAFVIELKGSDLTKAIRQIESTITKFKRELRGYNILPRVVIHKVSTHYINSSVYRNFKKLYPHFKIGSFLLEDVV